MILLYTPYDFFIFILSIFTLFYVSFHYLNFGLNKKEKNSKYLLLGFSALLFGLAFTRLISMFIILQIDGTFINHNFYITEESKKNTTIELLILFYNSSFLIGTVIFYFAIDKIYNKSHYILSIVNIFYLILIFINYFFRDLKLLKYPRELLYAFLVFNILILFFIFKWFISISDKDFQSIGILIMSSFSLFIFGSILSIEYIIKLNIIPLIIPSIIFITSSIILLIPSFIKKNLLYSKPLLFWIIFTILLILIIIIDFFFLLFYQTSLNPLIITYLWLILFGTIGFVGYNINRILKLNKKISEDHNRNILKYNILQLFDFPKEIREHDIKTSIEKKTCIVCKKKLINFCYVCFECNIFYCLECKNKILNSNNKNCLICQNLIKK
ncbi:MAG: hypothetical protein ACP6IY_14290 [Promethearchaeia archaeon]